jgi:hypothetical protein
MSDAIEWLAIESLRRRRHDQRIERAIRRAATMQRVLQGTAPNIQMRITEWRNDEHGNLSREIYAE